MVAFYCLDGNSYIEANRGVIKTGVPLELWNVRPDKMKVIPGPLGYPAAYEFQFGGMERRWDIDPVKMVGDICHWKTFHPINDWYGMSPLEAAMLALDQNLAGQRWNLALLQNSATPSGVLQVKVSDMNPRGEISPEQYARMRKDYEENYQGVANTGKPMIIEGGLTWTQMSMSPKDADYLKGKETSATDIAIAFGVLPELLGLGQKTYNNMKEARLAFYEETVLPTMDSAMNAVNRWLAPAFGEKLCLAYDKDDIEILQWKREQRYTSLQASSFLTQNEKRHAVGYEDKPEWDVFVIGQKVGALPEDFAAPAPVDPNAPITDPNHPDYKPENDPNHPDFVDPAKDPKKPGKKPSANDPAGKPDDENTDDSKGWKSLGLLTSHEKKQTWRYQNSRRKKLVSAFERDLQGDYRELISILKTVTGNHSDAKLTEYALINVMSDFMPTMERTLKRHIKYTLQDFGGMVLGEGKSLGLIRESKANLRYDSYVNHYTESRSGAAIKTITSTTTKQIRRIVGEWTQTAITDGDDNVELSKYIEAEFEELTPGQAMRIARTEVASASNNGSLEAVKSLQVPNMFKEWVTAEDDRVRNGEHSDANHEEMDGVEVGLDDKFSVPPDADMDGPGDGSASADQVINCRCVLVYRSKN